MRLSFPLLGACAWAVAVLAQPTPLVIRGAAVFDSEQGKFLPDRTLVIRDGRVELTGATRRVKVPLNGRIIDARGKYILPGLIDAHVHLTGILNNAHVTGDEVLPFYLANGVTTVRSAADIIPAEKLLVRYAAEHPERCPRIFMCSPAVGNYPPIHPDICWVLTKPEQVADYVSDISQWGITTLKIYANCLPSVARELIEQGHQKGLVVTGHLVSYPVADAIDAGIDAIEHIESVADFLRDDPKDRHSLNLSSVRARQLVAQIAEKRVFVTPTLTVFRNTLFFVDVPDVVEHPDNAHMPKRLLAFWVADRIKRMGNYSSGPLAPRQQTFQKYKDLTGMLYRAGTRLLVGTDAPCPQVPPGYSLHQEMRLLVESGIPPAEVLRAATLTNAEVLKEQDRLGSIREGRMADMVLLDANPLDDINNTRRIWRVVKDGRVLTPATILRGVPKE
jgi:imidazolonepropionase-like amidohydrolase